MLLTREEARERWCPQVRLWCGTAVGANADMENRNPSTSRCIADECAMWRWDTGLYGFCGLAGVPKDAM